MKSILSVAIATFLTIGIISAQHVNIGIKGGLNIYNIYNDNGTTNDVKPGFNVGLLGHIHIARQWALQPEVVFSAQGAKYSVGELDAKLNLNYINIPLLLQYMFDNGFRLEIGPQLGVLASATSIVENGDDTDIKSSFNTLEYGVGFGMSYVKPSTGFGVDLRYNLGLSNINENDAIVSTNRGIQIGLFYLFDHK